MLVKNASILISVQPFKVLGCDAAATTTPSPSTSSPPSTQSWYTFIIPDDFQELVGGRVYKISTECNKRWKDNRGDNCATYSERGWCSADTDKSVSAAEYFARDASDRDGDGILETALNCPQCGCGGDGVTNLNDIYANQ